MKLTILVATILFSSSVFADEPVKKADSIGKIVGQLGMAEGEVFVDNRAVKKSAPLREGSVVEVKDGKATLLLGTGSVFHLAANSKMTVKQFGMRADTKKEGGDISLSFGRTRALILNKGDETKDVRIQTRTATMGVRGTEVYVNAGERGSKAPVQFFTLEGKAHVDIPNAPRVEVKQNTGIATSGVATPGGQAMAEAPAMSVDEVKATIKSENMQVAKISTPNDMNLVRGEFTQDPSLVIPFPRFDPIQDRLAPITVVPKFCNATSTTGCP